MCIFAHLSLLLWTNLTLSQTINVRTDCITLKGSWFFSRIVRLQSRRV